MSNYEKGYAILHKVEVENTDIEKIKKIISEFSIIESYSEIDYWEMENKIRSKIPKISISQVKTVLEGLYWQGFYTDILGQMRAPAELSIIQIDYQNEAMKERD